MLGFCFGFGGRIRVFASLVGGDDQSKCKWVSGKNGNHYDNSPFPQTFKKLFWIKRGNGHGRRKKHVFTI